MRIAIDNGHRARKATLALVVVAAALGALAGGAQAASPAWKLLAATGPTNLPPKQSEVQRLTVEAEGGTFAIGYEGEEEVLKSEGKGTPVVVEAKLGLTAGSALATIESITGTGKIEPGDRITVPAYYQETTILSCSTDCETAGSTIEVSAPASTTETGALREIYTKELSNVTGTFSPGEEVVETFWEGFPYPYFPSGTVVTGTAPGSLTLSNPTVGYDQAEGAIGLRTEGRHIVPAEMTEPLPFDAPAEKVQAELESLPRFGAGSVTVEGGPGGNAEHPYFVEFDGPSVAEREVETLELETDELVGPTANGHVFTTVPGGPGTGEIFVVPTNVGGARSQGRARLRIGPLPPNIHATAPAKGEGWTCPETYGEPVIVCTSPTVIPAVTSGNSVSVPVEVDSVVPASSEVGVELSGAGGGTATYRLPVEVSATPAPFATRAFWAGAFDADGNLETQAGAHPYSAQTYFILNTVRAGSGRIIPAGVVKNVDVDLPAGFSGNPLATARCPQSQLVGFEERFTLCSEAGMSVGSFAPIVDRLVTGFAQRPFAIFNDVPAWGSAAEFTTSIVSPLQSLLGSVRSDGDFGIRITAPNVPNYYKVLGAYAALEGEPASAHGKAFLTNPTDCAAEAQHPPVTGLRTEAYELSGFEYAEASVPSVTGCSRLQFDPTFELRPTATQGSSPVGATAELHIPQGRLTDPHSLASPDLKKAVVTLPQGLTVNPSSANGLQACTEDQIGYERDAEPLPLNPTRFDEAPVTCPDASKIGTVSIKTPLLEEELEGTIYLAAQEENPFHSLIALYLVVESERFGITLKLPGEVRTDPASGQLTGVFDNNPQLPFEDLTLHFRGGGPRSTLATPEVCGTYKSTGSLEPWSAPESGPASQIDEAGFIVGTGCAPSANRRPFAPGFEAGTRSPQAGAYSPLVIKVSRRDGEQELKNLDFTLPKGFTGKLAGIPYCPNSAIATAAAKSGKAEQAAPSCPAASQIGTVDTAAGVGSQPIHVGGKVYLAGPYEGAPLSSVVVTPAVAGPFDLGDVVVRAPLFVDPETARITAKSDPIPTILKGIPLKVRSVAIDLGRLGFTLNPTSCDAAAVTASIVGSSGWTAKPANRFQVGGCDKLGFKPRLKLRLKGATRRTGHPALKAVVTFPKKGSYANIARAQVNLPHGEFLDQGNIDKACTKPVLLAGNCPKRSVYGHAKAWTPLLAKPLQGPVYLVGGYGYKLPALVAELNGQIRILLVGKVDSGKNKGIRNTFEVVPDAPVSRFELRMKGGKKYGLLENSENLCKAPQAKRRAIARFRGHNGKVDQYKPVVTNQCGKRPKKHKKNAAHGRTEAQGSA